MSIDYDDVVTVAGVCQSRCELCETATVKRWQVAGKLLCGRCREGALAVAAAVRGES